MREKTSWTEYVQPSLMAVASIGSVVASSIAIIIKADRTATGDINPFFYVAAINSALYTSANIYKIYQIWGERNPRNFLEDEQLKGELKGLIR